MSEGRSRADARRNREAVLDAAAAELRAGRRLDLQRVAAGASVSRSTVHRHFRDLAGVESALVERACRQASDAVAPELSGGRAPLAALRAVLLRLVEVGCGHGLGSVDARQVVEHAAHAARRLLPLALRLLETAEIEIPPQRSLDTGLVDLVSRALRAADAEPLFRSVTQPLDRGLVIVDRTGRLLSANDSGRALRDNAYYEDAAPAPADTHPLALAVATGETQPAAIRGYRLGEDDELCWFLIEAFALRLPSGAHPYAIACVIADVTEEREAQVRHLREAGTLGRAEPLILDAARALDEVPAHLLPDQLVAEARRLVMVPVALYVVDIDGSHLLRLAGAEEFPARMDAPLALGPELSPDGIPDLRARLAAELPGVALAPLWLRGRAVGVLLAAGGDEHLLAQLARQGAAAIELGNGYTDTLDAARRRKDINPAAEIQQSLLPPRIARLGSGAVASSILPAYEVGGDWFDYVENRDGAWLAIADASGKGTHAGALGGIGLAALRAARRNGAELEDAVKTVHETLCTAGEEDFYLTGIVARWSAAYRSFSWVNAGHPPPLLLRASGEIEELATEPDFPLGLFGRERKFRLHHRRIAPGERVLFYTDGISRRPTRDGFFGRDGIAAAVRRASDDSPTAVARAIQSAVVAATTDLLRDDAAVVVFAPDADFR